MVLRLNRTTNLGRLVLIFCITIFFTSISKVSFALPDDGPVKLAVVNSYDAGISAKHFSNTVAAIRAAIAPRRLEVHFYDQDDFLKDAAEKKFDLSIASSGLTAMMKASSGGISLLTAINKWTPDPNRANAGVIITHKDRTDINNLADLKGKKVGVSSTKAFAGFLAIMGEIETEGLNPNKLFGSVTTTHKPMTDLVKRVLNKEIEVAFIASCILENMERKNFEGDLSSIKVVNEKFDNNFYCRHSTHLYPGWMFSIQPTLDSPTLRAITISLLQLPVDKDEGAYWTVANDYDQMNLLLEKSQVRYLEDRTLGWLLHYYQWYFIAGAAVLLLILLNSVYLGLAIRRKTHQLQKKNQENEEYERENRKIQERIENLEKTNSIAIISAMVAHELKQPLGAINNYSEALLRQLSRNKSPSEKILKEALSEIKSESTRASDIIDFVRTIGRKERRERKQFNLERTVSRIISLMKRLGKLNLNCTLSGDKDLIVYADPLNVDLVLINLLKNAEEAVAGQPSPKIHVEIKKVGSTAQVTIEDNGPEMSDEKLASLSNLGHSSKKDGLGLGLAIVRELLEANGGSLKLSRVSTGGLLCVVTLPLALEDEDELR